MPTCQTQLSSWFFAVLKFPYGMWHTDEKFFFFFLIKLSDVSIFLITFSNFSSCLAFRRIKIWIIFCAMLPSLSINCSQYFLKNTNQVKDGHNFLYIVKVTSFIRLFVVCCEVLACTVANIRQKNYNFFR